ncbi:MAG TPA: hypothetical protein VFV03_06420 [Solirubrobacteraceae bacterium]|nr:hypothetical protein [Solirubrobacteraceae bacterium]
MWRSLKWWRLVALVVVATLAVPAIPNPDAQPAAELELGLVAGRGVPLQPRESRRLGARVVRVEFSIESSPRQLAPVIAAYARAGVRVLPLAGFIGRVPSQSEAEHLAAWAAAFGPGGSFWRHRAGGALAVRDIEFGNETSYSYQFGGCGSGCRLYMPRARAYALAFLAAQQAIAGPQGNPGVGLLAQADYGGDGNEWVNGMFDAVPDLAWRVAGWTVHTYGPRSRWQPRLDALIGQTRARGAPASIPIYITELGLASDNGACLSDNYDWSRCMTYTEAGSALSSTVASIRARYGARIHSIFVYQLADHASPGRDTNREDYFGVLRRDGSPKGAYTAAVRALLRANP